MSRLLYITLLFFSSIVSFDIVAQEVDVTKNNNLPNKEESQVETKKEEEKKEEVEETAKIEKGAKEEVKVETQDNKDDSNNTTSTNNNNNPEAKVSQEDLDKKDANTKKVKDNNDIISAIGKAKEGNIADILLGKNKVNSLMYTQEEYQKISDALRALENDIVYVPPKSLDSTELTQESEEEGKPEEELVNEKSYIYLASILYLSSDEWIVWINDEKITAQNNNKNSEFYIEKIFKDRINVLWKMGLTKWKIFTGIVNEEKLPQVNQDNRIEIRFTLRPNQTYSLTTGKVTEGKAKNKILIEKAVELF